MAGEKTTVEKLQRARRALERIMNTGKDRSEKAAWRIDEMTEEAEYALQDIRT